MGDEDVTTEAMQDSEYESEPGGLVITVFYLVFGLVFASFPFQHPLTTAQGFTSDAVPTINDRGDIDCGGSSLRVVLRGPRVAIPPGDLARRAEKACRDDAVEAVWAGVGGLAFVAICGSSLVRRARRYRARRRATGAGDSYDRVVPEVCALDSAALTPAERHP